MIESSNTRVSSWRVAGAGWVLLAAPLLVSTILYWPVITIDGGWLFTGDSQRHLRHPTGAFHPRELLTFTGYHFVPLPRLIYAAMQALFDTWWTPWGIAAVVCHALLVSSVGLVIYRFSRSRVAALAVSLPLATSWALSSGPLTNFAHAQLANLMTLIVLAPVIADRFVERPSRWNQALLFVASLAALGLSIPGLLFFPAACVAYAGLKYARSTAASWRAALWRPDRQDAAFVTTLAASLLVYGVAYWFALELNNWRFPVSHGGCAATAGLTIAQKLGHILALAYSGTFITQFSSAALVPPASPWITVANVGTGVLLVGAVYTLLAARPALIRHRRATAIFATCVLMGVAGATMLIAGRSCVALWHMRYNGYAVVEMAAAGGILLGVLLNLLPGRLRPVLSILVLVGALWVTVLNAQAVQVTQYMAGRTHMAFASPTLEQDLAQPQ